MMRRTATTVAAAVAAVVLLLQPSTCRAALNCFTDGECAAKLRKGSFCIDGKCSNPFAKGCLSTLLDDDEYKPASRVCNSDDLKAGMAGKDCTDFTEQFNYPEIRIHNSNWESSIFNAWIMQILLMEVVKVPVTVGLTKDNTAAVSFYSPQNTLEYSAVAYPWEALDGAGQCQNTEEECVHVFPEVWIGQQSTWAEAVNEGVIEPVEGNGQVGKISWYVPKFTVEKDPSLISFYGLQGEENRHKLAEEFKRPTTWEEYCEEVSTDKCAIPDNTAQGYPQGEDDKAKYWAPPSYTGHFRLMPEDNCTEYPDTCQGNFIAPPCGWSSNVDSQLYWNDIKMRPTGPLEPYGGYGYSPMIQVWRAAVHTKSSIIMWWWRPEALTEEFYGTDGQFQQILLPETTHACSRNRIQPDDRCSADVSARRGHPLGSCDQEAHALRKLISLSLKESSDTEPIATRSPGYDTIKSIKVSDLEMDTMLTEWILKAVDPYGNDAREAVCGWVAENLDELMRFVPAGYPKELSMNSPYDTPLMHTATALACFVGILVLATSAFAYKFRDKKVFIYAQAHIISLILFGFFLIIIGAIIVTAVPSDFVCVSTVWLINLGYTIELVPLLVKISAINKILTSAKKMKRVKITREGMLLNVTFVLVPLIVYLIVWTVVDPPRQVEERVISDESSTTIETSLSCESELSFWSIIAFGWQALLLLAATVLAFQSRHIEQEFNESRSLGTMIYSHFLFMVLRGVTYSLGQQEIILPNAASGFTSLLLSLDTLSAICIYLVPKCIEAKTGSSVAGSGSGMSVSHVTPHIHSSRVVSQIHANAMAAKVSLLSSGHFDTSARDVGSGSGSGSGSSGPGSVGRIDISNQSRSRGPVLSKYSSNMEDIIEGSQESSSHVSKGDEGASVSSGSKQSSGSRASKESRRTNSTGSFGFRLDVTGSIVPNLVGEDEMAPVVAISAAGLEVGSNHSHDIPQLPHSTQTTQTTSSARVDDDIDSDEEDEHDWGGPRFTSAVQNEKLVQRVSQTGVDVGNGQTSSSLKPPHVEGELFELEALKEVDNEGEESSTNINTSKVV